MLLVIMGNSLANDVAFILMEFRNARKCSNWKYSTCTFRILDNALLYVQILSYFKLIEYRAFNAYFAYLDLSSSCYCIIKTTKELLIVYRST